MKHTRDVFKILHEEKLCIRLDLQKCYEKSKSEALRFLK